MFVFYKSFKNRNLNNFSGFFTTSVVLRMMRLAFLLTYLGLMRTSGAISRCCKIAQSNGVSNQRGIPQPSSVTKFDYFAKPFLRVNFSLETGSVSKSTHKKVVFWTLRTDPVFARRSQRRVLIFASIFQCSGCVNESTHRIRPSIDR